MPKLFSYVVDHDCGYAPCPFGDFCTLAKCKYGTVKTKNGFRRNMLELAAEGDWIAGTGGVDTVKSAGHGKLIYAMRVDEKITLEEYCEANESHRFDADFDIPVENRFALMSYHYFYFGRNAIDISGIPRKHLDHPFEKTGPSHRCDFSEEFVKDFAEWLERHFKVGVHGPPCKRVPELALPRCPAKVRRKRCSG